MTLPILHIDLPRPVMSIHQIEVTSRCNLRCTYCPSPQMMKATAEYTEGQVRESRRTLEARQAFPSYPPPPAPPRRPAMDMAEDVFEAALALAKVFVERGTQHELNLAGIGESTIHPKFPAWLRLARHRLGGDVVLVFATNGIVVNDDILSAVKDTGARVWVSLHRPEKAGLAVEAYRKIGALDGVSSDPSINAYDWAGQVEWFNSPREYPVPCQWIRRGKVFVRADGSIATCCVDAKGDGTLVADIRKPDVVKDIFSNLIKPYDLCKTCTQEIGVQGYVQR